MWRNCALTLILSFFVFIVNASAPKGFAVLKDTTTFKTKMTVASKKINTLESDFEQIKHLSILSEKVKSKGHFQFKKDNKLKWAYTTPYNYSIFLNDDKMYIKDKGKVSKYNTKTNKLFKGINDMLLNIVKGNLFDTKEYKIEYFYSSKEYFVRLTPRKATTQKFLKTIELNISKTDYSVTKVKMAEPSGDYTSITFTNRKTNKAIPDAVFKP